MAVHSAKVDCQQLFEMVTISSFRRQLVFDDSGNRFLQLSSLIKFDCLSIRQSNSRSGPILHTSGHRRLHFLYAFPSINSCTWHVMYYLVHYMPGTRVS